MVLGLHTPSPLHGLLSVPVGAYPGTVTVAPLGLPRCASALPVRDRECRVGRSVHGGKLTGSTRDGTARGRGVSMR